MKNYTKITSLVIISVIVSMIAYDFWIIETAGKDASISQVLIDYFYKYPIGGISLGIVIGHIGWRMPDRFPITSSEIDIIMEHRKKNGN